MKKVVTLVVAVLLTLNFVSAQNGEDIFGSNTNERYTLGTLDNFGKLELTRIYVQQIQKLNLILPYCAYNPKGEAVSLKNMGIPDSKDNHNYIKRLDQGAGDYNQVLDTTLAQLIPYSDKANIIRSILFVQDVIERLESGL